LIRGLLNGFRWGVLPVPGRVIGILFFVALFLIPLFMDHPYYLRMFTYANLFVIFAVSWDLLSGYTGQVNFGHALFFGVAGYGSALMHKYFGWQPELTIPIAVVASTGIGVVACLPALRLRGPYLSLYTLALPIMLLGVIISLRDITGGEHGIRGLPLIAATRVGQYYIALIVMVISVLIMWKLTDAGSKYVRTGLLFHAIREDEIAARASGINTIRYKILAFAIGGLFAAIAGALYPHVRGTIGPTSLALTTSFLAVIWTIFGGIVSIYGPVVGVYTLYPIVYLAQDIKGLFERAVAGAPNVALTRVMEFLQSIFERPYLVLAVIVILVLLFMPEGLAVRIRNRIEEQCPRCKLTNAAWRRDCRACGASLRYVADENST